MKAGNLHTASSLIDLTKRAGNVSSVSVAKNGSAKSDQTGNAKPVKFAQELKTASSLQFSKHARARMHSRGIELSEQKLSDLNDAIEKANLKGAKETLVLTDDIAFVVSAPNKMVISAFDRAALRDGVFTSIDSAIII